MHKFNAEPPRKHTDIIHVSLRDALGSRDVEGNLKFASSQSFGRDENRSPRPSGTGKQVSSAEPEHGTHLSIRLSPHFLTPSVRTGSDCVQHVVVVDTGRHPCFV